MCRIAIFPPFTTRKNAIKVLNYFCRQNTDGTGAVFVNNGEFVIQKHPESLHWVLRNDKTFLSHMENGGYDGWTLAHLRMASHGGNKYVNTHPFVVGNRAIIHNGIWSEYALVRLALSRFCNIQGETDSEVAANFLDIVGIDSFTENVDMSGVFASLNRDGTLEVAKTSGDLVLTQLKGDRILLASELNFAKYETQRAVSLGWMAFDKDGRYQHHRCKSFTKYEYNPVFQKSIQISEAHEIKSDIKDITYQKSPVTSYQICGGPGYAGYTVNHSGARPKEFRHIWEKREEEEKKQELQRYAHPYGETDFCC